MKTCETYETCETCGTAKHVSVDCTLYIYIYIYKHVKHENM